MQYLLRYVSENDATCISQLHMDKQTFTILCEMGRDVGGLRDTRNITLEEIVAMFVYVLAHHKKNRTVAHKFLRSGETVSRHVNQCLLVVLKLHRMLVKTPMLISDDYTDDCWKYFKNCLGALDGTLISVTPPAEYKSRYRTRKSNLATNVLGVCAPDMQFIYVLPGWEGSAHDGRVLQDGISRPNGLKVPQDKISWHRPESAEEYFNMKHAKARNVIERYVASELHKLEKLNSTFTSEPTSWLWRLYLKLCVPLFWALRHKEARGIWNMKFPYLDELELVYGKDRANGEAIEDSEDTVNNLETEEKSAETASYVNCETDNEISISTSRIQKRQTVHFSKKPKKLKTSAAPAPSPMEAQFEMVMNKFISSIDGIAAHFASIVTAMTNEDKCEQSASDRSNSLVAELVKLELC
ncbi:hypothetical protein ACH5RR_001422 [Cinchona calisaya]|uniref:DDE Tnp4 domain-containing protein n=1 Tax=Cinchona calisaya TaxID=153742 RepID=A0ABD3B401_9GENT